MDTNHELAKKVSEAINKQELNDMPSGTVTDTDYIPNQNPVAQDYEIEE